MSKNMNLSSALRVFLFISLVIFCSGCLVLDEGHLKAQKVINASKKRERAALIRRSASLDSLASEGKIAVGMSQKQLIRAYGRPDWKTNMNLPDGMGRISNWNYRSKMESVVVVNGYVSDIIDVVKKIEETKN